MRKMKGVGLGRAVIKILSRATNAVHAYVVIYLPRASEEEE